jgi:phosphoserine phosphatase
MIAAAIFDLDGTLTLTPNPWRHLHEALGVWERAEGHFGQWQAGEIDYHEFCRRDYRLWAGQPLAALHAHLDRIALNRHVPAVVSALGARRIPSVIISSGFHHVARRVRDTHQWTRLTVHANELVEGPEVRVGVSADPGHDLSKRRLGRAALVLLGVDAADTLVVSDGVHDLESLDYCGHHLHIREEDDLYRTLEFLK